MKASIPPTDGGGAWCSGPLLNLSISTPEPCTRSTDRIRDLSRASSRLIIRECPDELVDRYGPRPPGGWDELAGSRKTEAQLPCEVTRYAGGSAASRRASMGWRSRLRDAAMARPTGRVAPTACRSRAATSGWPPSRGYPGMTDGCLRGAFTKGDAATDGRARRLRSCWRIRPRTPPSSWASGRAPSSVISLTFGRDRV